MMRLKSLNVTGKTVKIKQIFEQDIITPDDDDPADFVKLRKMTDIPHHVQIRATTPHGMEEVMVGEFDHDKDIPKWYDWIGQNGFEIDMSGATKEGTIAEAKKMAKWLTTQKGPYGGEIRVNQILYQLASRHYDSFSGHMVDISHARWTDVK